MKRREGNKRPLGGRQNGPFASQGRSVFPWVGNASHRAPNGRLQQGVVSTNRCARWRSCPLTIGRSKEPSDGNQELDCHRKMAFFAVPLAGNKVAISASSDELEASIASFSAVKEGDVTSSPSLLVNNQRSANRYFVCRR